MDERYAYSTGAAVWQTNRENNTVLTPVDLFLCADDEYNFTCDPTPEGGADRADVPDAMRHDWGARVWLNPPYKDAGDWVDRAIDQYRRCYCTVVLLLPVRTDTGWWGRLWATADEIWFIQRRVRFVGYDKNYPIPLAFIVLGARPHPAPRPSWETVDRRGYTLQVVRLRQRLHPSAGGD